MHDIPGVRHLCPFVPLILLAVWLPATLHCDLEVVGAMLSPGTDCCATAKSCSNDGCDVLERGLYRSVNDLVKVPAPGWSVCRGPFCSYVPPVADSHQKIVPPPESLERPCDWVPSWQFVRRAAPPSRAPDCALA